MPGDFSAALSGEDEIQVEFVRKDGRTRKIPIWFSLDGDVLELLPMYGLKTKWFIDVERTGRLDLETKGSRLTASPRIVKDEDEVDSIKRRFALKYGEGDVRRYYPTSEVALKIQV